MTNEVKNVPELRFPNFSEEWKKFVFKDQIISIEKGTDLLGSEDNMGIPLIKMGNIKRGYFSFNKLEKLRESETIQEKYYIKKGDFLFNTRNTMELVGKSATWTNKSDKFAFNSNIARIVLKDIDTYFFNYLYNTSKMINKVKSLAVGTTSVAAIYPRDLNHLNYFLPLIAEQEKIGEFFSKLDQQIELEEQKLEKLEEQKKGYMQKIFSQELRFKDENGNDYPEWEDKLISDIGKVVTGNTPSKKDNDYWNSNQYVWVTPTDISNKKNIYTSGYQLSQKGFSKARQLPKNTLLITCIASIGKNAILRIEGSCNQQINAVIPNDNYDVDYLYYAFEDVSKLMKSIAGKTATQIVNKAVFEKLLLNVPIYEEQQKISGFLNKVDILIDKQTQKIDELKLRKQGFLQKMFV